MFPVPTFMVFLFAAAYTVIGPVIGVFLGATTDEIMQVLKLGAVQGMQACTLGVSILAEELERNAASQRASA